MHRFTWDLRYPRPLAARHASRGPNGPAAVRENIVRITAGSVVPQLTRFTVIEDPPVITPKTG